jgi:hypothetical protein
MTSGLISVLLPYRNADHVIHRALISIAGQLENHELILELDQRKNDLKQLNIQISNQSLSEVQLQSKFDEMSKYCS